VSDLFNVSLIQYEGYTTTQFEGAHEGSRYWDMKPGADGEQTIFFDTNHNNIPDYVVRVTPNEAVWEYDGGGWKQIKEPVR
jgi:hypothetical protein